MKAAENFANLVNEKIKDSDDSDMQDIIIQTQLPEKLNRKKKKKKKLSDELSCDEIIGETSNDKFRINFFTVIMDNVINNIEYRFNTHKELYLDLQWL